MGRPATPEFVAVAGCFSALLLLGAGAVQGQDDSGFFLFEPVDSASSAGNSNQARGRSRASAERGGSDPEFSLIGTSRIGLKTSVMLRHASGEKVRVPLERPKVRIPGHEQYTVIGSDVNSVSIQYPQSVVCEEFAAKGVSCDATRNIATLNLRVFQTAEQSHEQIEPDQLEFERKGAKDAPINPFEALRNRPQNSSSTPGRADRFRPRRIDPADVPTGMRVVSTPFGDRLVEE